MPYTKETAHIRFAANESSRSDFLLAPTSRPGSASAEPLVGEGYFSIPVVRPKLRQVRYNFNFWGELPSELQVQVLSYLKPKQIIQCSAVSNSWRKMCFDGQLWANLDAAEFYREIPATGLIKVIKHAGPFLKDLNLRGCVQLSTAWKTENLSGICKNLENLCLEGSRIDRPSVHALLGQNEKLVHINLSGMDGVNNKTMKIIADNCPRLELLNISWCEHIDGVGLTKVIKNCPFLKDLRAGEVRGFDDQNLLLALHKQNAIERLLLQNCDTLTDESLKVLFEGIDAEVDIITGRPVVPPRNLKHLDISRCRNFTDAGIAFMAGNLPFLEGLQLSRCNSLTDDGLLPLLPTLPSLTHLDLEEIDTITNASLQVLAKSPCRHTLRHLSISSCEHLGDVGMLPVIKECKELRNLDLDNTRISDLVLAEAAQMVRERYSSVSPPTTSSDCDLTPTMSSTSLSPITTTTTSTIINNINPRIGLRMVVYDCQNVTWTGIREVLSCNSEIRTTPFPAAPLTMQPNSTDSNNAPTRSFSLSRPKHEIITLKCFYGYQPTVAEHTRRILRGDLAAAARLERKWAEYMMASEEAGQGAQGGGAAGGGVAVTGGYGNRRRRRRAREARMMHADEQFAMADVDADGEGGGGDGGFVGRRRRARSGPGCAMM